MAGEPGLDLEGLWMSNALGAFIQSNTLNDYDLTKEIKKCEAISKHQCKENFSSEVLNYDSIIGISS